MRIITLLQISLMLAAVGVTASSRPGQAQTSTQSNQSSSTISQTSLSESLPNPESKPSAIVTQTPEATKTESQSSPTSFRIPLSSRIFPSASMQQ